MWRGVCLCMELPGLAGQHRQVVARVFFSLSLSHSHTTRETERRRTHAHTHLVKATLSFRAARRAPGRLPACCCFCRRKGAEGNGDGGLPHLQAATGWTRAAIRGREKPTRDPRLLWVRKNKCRWRATGKGKSAPRARAGWGCRQVSAFEGKQRRGAPPHFAFVDWGNGRALGPVIASPPGQRWEGRGEKNTSSGEMSGGGSDQRAFRSQNAV